jgi:Protein of unknown function (DUF4065)
VAEILYEDEKFRELMLYVARRMEDDPTFGATVLNKVLFFSDFSAYLTLGSPITGATYQKLEYGPAPRRLLPEQQRLIAEGRAVLQERVRGGRKQRRLVVLDEPKIDGLFKPSEIALVDRVIERLWGRGAVGASDISHTQSVGWRAAELYEDIPYASVFLVPPSPPTPRQERRARELVSAHGQTGRV